MFFNTKQKFTNVRLHGGIYNRMQREYEREVNASKGEMLRDFATSRCNADRKKILFVNIICINLILIFKGFERVL